jgi:hypothetical protein
MLEGHFMRAIHRTANWLLIGGSFTLAMFSSVANGQARQGRAPSEANFFIGTPGRMGAAEDALGRSGSAGNLAAFLCG